LSPWVRNPLRIPAATLTETGIRVVAFATAILSRRLIHTIARDLTPETIKASRWRGSLESIEAGGLLGLTLIKVKQSGTFERHTLR